VKARTPSQADPFALIAPHYDALMSTVPYDLWVQYVAQLASRAGRPIRPDTSVLDLATGTGSVALEFAALGCRVTGIDCSEPMLVEARRKASARGFDIPFLCHDLADFRLPPDFDCAVCLYDSLNYILDPDKLKRAFAHTRAALNPGGLLIFDVNTVHALEAELFTQQSRPRASVEYRWRSKYDRKKRISRVKMDFRVHATRQRISSVHYQRAYTDAEFRSSLAAAGFDRVTAYDAYRFVPPDPQSDRVFYVARAPH
jgi:ubiquinone/menaquinone biosynthesis C-methylase UbiE